MLESINEQKEWKSSDFPLTNVSEMTFFFTSVTQKLSLCLLTVVQVLMRCDFCVFTWHTLMPPWPQGFKASSGRGRHCPLMGGRWWTTGVESQVPSFCFLLLMGLITSPSPKSPNDHSKGTVTQSLQHKYSRGAGGERDAGWYAAWCLDKDVV